MRVLSVGEILWDIFPEREHLGGAPLNFSANAARLGNRAALMTAVGNDRRGDLAREAMVSLGLETQFVQVIAERATGTAAVSVSPEGEPRFEILRPAAFDALDLSPEALGRAKRMEPDWMYFGTLVQVEPEVERVTRQLYQALPHVRCFYDMNLRPGFWNLPLVERLCRMATVLKLNEFEAETLGELTGMGAEDFSLEHFCERWSALYELESICVTLGPAGCLIYENGTAHTVPGFPASVEDTVGAGDAFAAAFLHGFHHRWPTLRTARFANALGSIVASRAGATPPWTLEECFELAAIPLERADALQTERP